MLTNRNNVTETDITGPTQAMSPFGALGRC